MTSVPIRWTIMMFLAGGWACAVQSGTNVRRDVEEMLRLAGDRTMPSPGEILVLRVDTIPVGATRAFLILESVYRTLGLELEHVTSSERQLGGTTQRLGPVEGKSPSAWLDCGQSVNSTSHADSYDVTLSVASRVLAIQGFSAVETVLRGKAQPRDVSGAMITCTSQGTLERRIADLVVQRAR